MYEGKKGTIKIENVLTLHRSWEEFEGKAQVPDLEGRG